MTYFLNRNGCVGAYELFTLGGCGGKAWVKDDNGDVRRFADAADAVQYATDNGGNVKSA